MPRGVYKRTPDMKTGNHMKYKYNSPDRLKQLDDSYIPKKVSETLSKRSKNLSESMKKENHPNWKGGLSRSPTEASRGRSREYQRKLRAFRKNIVLEHYGNKCVCCKEKNKQFLTIDHIHNDGTEHRKILGGSGGGSIIIAWIVKNNFPENMFQILCYNCNMSKGVYGECPHKSEEYAKNQPCEHNFKYRMCTKCEAPQID